jgi:hypothetical protein
MRIVAVLLFLSVASTASADRPTSDALSLISGRTVGNGEVVISAGLGWPGFFAEILFSPSSTFDLSLRGHVDYGGLIGTATGVAGGLSVPMRLHVYGADDIDVAIAARPFALFGEGAIMGEEGVFADDFAYALGLEAGVRAGFHVSDAATLTVGAAGLFAWTNVKGAGGGAVGGGAPLVGVEANFNRSTLFFAELLLGYAGAPENRFSRQMWMRLALGIGYRL